MRRSIVSATRHACTGPPPPNAISVETIDHVVYLNGLVEGFGSETAESAADQVPGVSAVVNSVTDDPQ